MTAPAPGTGPLPPLGGFDALADFDDMPPADFEAGLPTPPIYDYTAGTGGRSVQRGRGLIATKVRGGWDTNFRPRPSVTPPDTYHSRSVFNPLELIGGHRFLRLGALAHRAVQWAGILPGKAEVTGASGVKRERYANQFFRGIRNLGAIAAGAAVVGAAAVNVVPDILRALPSSISEPIINAWETNSSTSIWRGLGAVAAVGAIAGFRAVMTRRGR